MKYSGGYAHGLQFDTCNHISMTLQRSCNAVIEWTHFAKYERFLDSG